MQRNSQMNHEVSKFSPPWPNIYVMRLTEDARFAFILELICRGSRFQNHQTEAEHAVREWSGRCEFKISIHQTRSHVDWLSFHSTAVPFVEFIANVLIACAFRAKELQNSNRTARIAHDQQHHKQTPSHSLFIQLKQKKCSSIQRTHVYFLLLSFHLQRSQPIQPNSSQPTHTTRHEAQTNNNISQCTWLDKTNAILMTNKSVGVLCRSPATRTEPYVLQLQWKEFSLPLLRRRSQQHLWLAAVARVWHGEQCFRLAMSTASYGERQADRGDGNDNKEIIMLLKSIKKCAAIEIELRIITGGGRCDSSFVSRLSRNTHAR